MRMTAMCIIPLNNLIQSNHYPYIHQMSDWKANEIDGAIKPISTTSVPELPTYQSYPWS
jgi:hypothetical protein